MGWEFVMCDVPPLSVVIEHFMLFDDKLTFGAGLRWQAFTW